MSWVDRQVERGSKTPFVIVCSQRGQSDPMSGHVRSSLSGSWDLIQQSWCQDHNVTRKRLRACTAASGHNLPRTASVRHSAAISTGTGTDCRQRKTTSLAATSKQSTAVLTPLLQLQQRLQDSGATVDDLDLSYKQCLAARKLRHGEVYTRKNINKQVVQDRTVSEPLLCRCC